MAKRIIWVLFAVVAAFGVAVVYLIQDANRFKPDIEALIAEQSDVQVRIGGDLAWSLWPPLTLKVADIVATQDGLTVEAGELALKMDMSAMWQDINAWKVSSLALSDVTLQQPEATTVIHRASIADFRPGQAAPFAVDLLHTPQTGTPTRAEIDGLITYFEATPSQPQRLSFADTNVNSNLAQGNCQGDQWR